MSGIAIQNDGVVISGGGLCLGCCVYPGPPVDSSCFLEGGLLSWSNIVTYAVDDLVEILTLPSLNCGTFRSKVNGNLNNPPSSGGSACIPINRDKWEWVSRNTSCNNPDWNSISPWGGFGGTPDYYTMAGEINWEATGRTTILCNNMTRFTAHSWSAYCTDSDGKTALCFFSHVTETIPYCAAYTTVMWWRDEEMACNYMNVGDTAYSVMGYPEINCLLKADLTGGRWPDTGSLYEFWLAVKKTGEGGTDCDYGLTATVSVYPGQIPEWDECNDYDVGDKVAWDGLFYICIQGHNAGTPPACTGQIEPGVHGDWELYWELL